MAVQRQCVVMYMYMDTSVSKCTSRNLSNTIILIYQRDRGARYQDITLFFYLSPIPSRQMSIFVGLVLLSFPSIKFGPDFAYTAKRFLFLNGQHGCCDILYTQDTIKFKDTGHYGNCPRPVYTQYIYFNAVIQNNNTIVLSFGVSQHMHKITIL